MKENVVFRTIYSVYTIYNIADTNINLNTDENHQNEISYDHIIPFYPK